MTKFPVIAPGKRPLSSMNPTLVLRDDRPVLATGSPGGSTIPTMVLQVILNMLEHGRSVQAAVTAPRLHYRDSQISSSQKPMPCLTQLFNSYDNWDTVLFHWAVEG